MIAFHKELPDAAIYVIDKNSRDATNSIAVSNTARAWMPWSVLTEKRQGKGMRCGARHGIDRRCPTCFADADMTIPLTGCRPDAADPCGEAI